MSKKLSDGTFISYSEKPQQCDYCGKISELRPYGKDEACICFQCGMRNEKETTDNFHRILEE